MGKGFRDMTGVHCGARPAATVDHAFAREFFVADRRANLRKVPACHVRNNAASKLERYLPAITQAIP
jgi:hypothetical protein